MSVAESSQQQIFTDVELDQNYSVGLFVCCLQKIQVVKLYITEHFFIFWSMNELWT